MSWSLTSEGKGFAVYTETLTTKSLGNGTSNFSSMIDFIPPGTDFTVIANAAKTDLSTSTHVELFVAYDRSAAVASATGRALRYRRAVTPFIPVTGEIDNATKVFTVDVSSKGQFPYYFLKVPKGGGSVKFVVTVGQPSVGLL